MYQSAWRRLWCIAISIVHDRGIAEDVLQEAAIIAMGKLDQFRDGTSFAAWMGQIVRFTALNHARSRKRRRTLSEIKLHQVGARHDGSPVTPRGTIADAQSQFDDDLLRALMGLDPTACACLLLRTVEELSYREISEALQIPEGTAMSHVHRSRKALRETLGEEGGAAK